MVIKMKIRLYQCNCGTEEGVKLVFCDLVYIRSRLGGEVPRRAYRLVYEGEAPDDLEKVFLWGQTRRDFRAVSVSDVIELENGVLWFCDTVGFRRICWGKNQKSAAHSVNGVLHDII